MKKLLSLILIVITFIVVASFCTACYSFKSGGLLFTEVEGGYQVTGTSLEGRFYKNFSVNIPDFYNGKPVVAISDNAFNGYTSLISISIPNTVKTIGDHAFFGCVLLGSVNIPDSVTHIGHEAFSGCLALTNVTIPEGIITIGGEAFSNCANLTYNIHDNARYLGNSTNPYIALIGTTSKNITTCNIHPNAKMISNYAFVGCEDLINVTVPDGLTTIGFGAFGMCSNLTSVSIGDSITAIGWNAFSNCDNLIYNIYDNAKYLGNDRNPYLALVGVTSKDITSCNIHSDAKIISDSAFIHCNNLTVVNISDSVVIIDGYAFYDCTSLISVTIGDGVTRIGESAFSNCTSLKSVVIPESINTIEKNAFHYCDSIQAVCYRGGQANWEEIKIGIGNEPLNNANFVFNSNNS